MTASRQTLLGISTGKKQHLEKKNGHKRRNFTGLLRGKLKIISVFYVFGNSHVCVVHSFLAPLKFSDSPIFFSVFVVVVCIVPSPWHPTEYASQIQHTKCIDNSPYLINFIYVEGRKKKRQGYDYRWYFETVGSRIAVE